MTPWIAKKRKGPFHMEDPGWVRTSRTLCGRSLPNPAWEIRLQPDTQARLLAGAGTDVPRETFCKHCRRAAS